jgi:hypothetical protein
LAGSAPPSFDTGWEDEYSYSQSLTWRGQKLRLGKGLPALLEHLRYFENRQSTGFYTPRARIVARTREISFDPRAHLQDQHKHNFCSDIIDTVWSAGFCGTEETWVVGGRVPLIKEPKDH